MTAFKQAARPREDAELRTYARGRFPGLTERWDDAALQMKVARARQLTDPLRAEEPDVAFVLDLVLMFGEDFDQEPWADVFSLHTMGVRSRFDILRHRCAAFI